MDETDKKIVKVVVRKVENGFLAEDNYNNRNYVAEDFDSLFKLIKALFS